MSALHFPAIIDGQPHENGEWLDVTDPGTGKSFARIARCGPDEVDAAVRAARGAFEAGWRSTEVMERAALLAALARAIMDDSEALARIESQDTGKPLSQAMADVKICARYFSFYASVVENLHGETIPVRRDAFAFSVREPFGVTGHITPWNYPLQIAGRMIAPALAAGNCCVLKPAEEAPLSAIRLAQLALAAGFPAGAFNVVPGLGIEAGAALAAHPGIDLLAFTGSRPVGSAVARAAADNVVPVTLELGGKSPNIVFSDANLAVALPQIVNSIIQNAGQTCSAGSRLLVHKDIYGCVVDAVAEAFGTVTMGPGLTDRAMGPLISDKQRRRVVELVEGAKREARLVTGGVGVAGNGFFFPPTLFADVPVDARIWQEEVFGPVVVAAPFEDDADAVRLANSTDFGLISAIWTQDISRAHRLIPQLRCGQIFVNSYGAGGGAELPFGGYKRSGYGREKGFEGLLGYTQLKTVLINHANGGPG